MFPRIPIELLGASSSQALDLEPTLDPELRHQAFRQAQQNHHDNKLKGEGQARQGAILHQKLQELPLQQFHREQFEIFN